jgi:predicted metal-dependent hydrolase
MSKQNPIHPYTVRVSNKAKRVRLQVSVTDGLVVIVPKGFDQRQIPTLVEERAAWIDKAIGKVQQQAQTIPEPAQVLPDTITLRAIEQTWAVSYTATPETYITWSEQPDNHLAVWGAVAYTETGKEALRQWLTYKTKQYLIPMLRTLSEQHQQPFGKAIVRGQKTRWASCSSNQTISINRKLLFLPVPLVQYIFIHELCHLVHMNHSPAFWKLVEQREPNYRTYEKELRNTAQLIPQWV